MAGCGTPAPPTASPQPVTPPVAPKDVGSTLPPEAERLLVAFETELKRWPDAEEGQLATLDEKTLDFVAGPTDTRAIPVALKAMTQSVFDSLLAARPPNAAEITLDFRAGRLPVIQAREHRILVSAGALAFVRSREDMAKLLALEITLIDAGEAFIRYRTYLLAREITRIAKAELRSADTLGTMQFGWVGAYSALYRRIASHEPAACNLRNRAGFVCADGANGGIEAMEWLSRAARRLEGTSFLAKSMDDASPIAGDRDVAWMTATRGLRVGAALGDIAGSAENLTARQDRLALALTDAAVLPAGSGVYVVWGDGIRGFFGPRPRQELMTLGFLRSRSQRGSGEHLGQPADWISNEAAGEHFFNGRWHVGERTYEFMLRGDVSHEDLRRKFTGILTSIRPLSENEPAAKLPERHIALAQVQSRADAQALAVRMPVVLGQQVSSTELFLLLNGVSSFEELPDGPQVIRYLE